jgi:hypothetical protein
LLHAAKESTAPRPMHAGSDSRGRAGDQGRSAWAGAAVLPGARNDAVWASRSC